MVNKILAIYFLLIFLFPLFTVMTLILILSIYLYDVIFKSSGARLCAILLTNSEYYFDTHIYVQGCLFKECCLL